MVIDATQEVTEQDTKIAGLIHEEGKGIILVMNKWDLIEKDTNTMNQYRRRLINDLAFYAIRTQHLHISLNRTEDG